MQTDASRPFAACRIHRKRHEHGPKEGVRQKDGVLSPKAKQAGQSLQRARLKFNKADQKLNKQQGAPQHDHI